MGNKEFTTRIRYSFGVCLFHALLLFLCQSFLETIAQTLEDQQDGHHLVSTAQRIKKSKRREGEWLITEVFDRNNFVLDFVPKTPIIKITDTDPTTDVYTQLRYKGHTYLNAWASDEDFDVAPRYVERYSGIKFATAYKRFQKSEQAYGYTYVNADISEDGLGRKIDIDASKFGPSCMQDGVQEEYMHEDCLYLNIWRPSRWKQSLNTTSKCKQKFFRGGIFKKLCEVIVTTRTIDSDGSITIKTNVSKTVDNLPMGGLYDKDGSLFNEDTDILERDDLDEILDKNKIKRKGKGKLRNLQSLSDTLDNAMDNLDQALEDLKEVIEDSSDSEDERPNKPGYDPDEPSTLGTYNIDSSGLLPVMVYIHGGGFVEGSGNDPLYDGSKAAGRGQVIVITLNYRLGIFGFLPSFGWDQWKVNGGMNGFGDIVEALVWINRNIKQWGGNPNKVTVFGPASTPAVCLLTMCPAAEGLFQRAILQTATRETEIREGKISTNNGMNGASCLLSSQEPYQPLEGRIEIAYRIFDYVNDTYYNFPENPDPSREDLIDYMTAPWFFNSTAMLQLAKDEGSVFIPQRPAASFDYNRDETVTDTQQRRTFVTWDNDLFPQMPVNLEEYAIPYDIMVGVRGRGTADRVAPPFGSSSSSSSSSDEEEDPYELEKQSLHRNENKDNVFLRKRNGSHRTLEEKGDFKGANDDYFDFYAVYYDDDVLLKNMWFEGENETETETTTLCSNYSDPDFDFEGNETYWGNETEWGNETYWGNETECEEELLVEEEVRNFTGFDFSGTTSDQELCVAKQYAELMARNVKGNVYGYVIDDGTNLHGYHRRMSEGTTEGAEQLHRGLRVIRPMMGFDYDLESLYFFDNFYVGSNLGRRREQVKIRKELFNRWINFAKTGNPMVTKRSLKESKEYARWDAWPNGTIGLDTNKIYTYKVLDHYNPTFLYMSADRDWRRQGHRKTAMIGLDDLLSHRTLWKYPHNPSNTDVCSWVLDEENDHDADYVDVLLDFNANTAFEYYVTILATLNPTINYVPDREYVVKMPPTMAPTAIQDFLDKSLEIEISSSPTSLTRMATTTTLITVLIGAAATVLVGAL